MTIIDRYQTESEMNVFIELSKYIAKEAQMSFYMEDDTSANDGFFKKLWNGIRSLFAKIRDFFMGSDSKKNTEDAKNAVDQAEQALSSPEVDKNQLGQEIQSADPAQTQGLITPALQSADQNILNRFLSTVKSWAGDIVNAAGSIPPFISIMSAVEIAKQIYNSVKTHVSQVNQEKKNVLQILTEFLNKAKGSSSPEDPQQQQAQSKPSILSQLGQAKADILSKGLNNLQTIFQNFKSDIDKHKNSFMSLLSGEKAGEGAPQPTTTEYAIITESGNTGRALSPQDFQNAIDSVMTTMNEASKEWDSLSELQNIDISGINVTDQNDKNIASTIINVFKLVFAVGGTIVAIQKMGSIIRDEASGPFKLILDKISGLSSKEKKEEEIDYDAKIEELEANVQKVMNGRKYNQLSDEEKNVVNQLNTSRKWYIQNRPKNIPPSTAAYDKWVANQPPAPDPTPAPDQPDPDDGSHSSQTANGPPPQPPAPAPTPGSDQPDPDDGSHSSQTAAIPPLGNIASSVSNAIAGEPDEHTPADRKRRFGDVVQGGFRLVKDALKSKKAKEDDMDALMGEKIRAGIARGEDVSDPDFIRSSMRDSRTMAAAKQRVAGNGLGGKIAKSVLKNGRNLFKNAPSLLSSGADILGSYDNPN